MPCLDSESWVRISLFLPHECGLLPILNYVWLNKLVSSETNSWNCTEHHQANRKMGGDKRTTWKQHTNLTHSGPQSQHLSFCFQFLHIKKRNWMTLECRRIQRSDLLLGLLTRRICFAWSILVTSGSQRSCRRKKKFKCTTSVHCSRIYTHQL